DDAARVTFVTTNDVPAGARAAIAQVEVLHDATPPTTHAEPALAYLRAPTAFTLVAQDGGSGPARTSAALDDGAWRTTRVLSVDAPADGSRDGAHTLHFASTDHSGNVEPARDAVVTVDTQPPVTTLEAPEQPQTGPFAVTLNATDATSGVAAERSRLW